MTAASALRDSIREIADPSGDLRNHPVPTIDKQVPPMNRPADQRPRRTSHAQNTQNRTLAMQLMPEALARVQHQERLEVADRERMVRALRLKRRAERATLRARRALAGALL
ncbi:hypothetical protein [Streptacidiphilus fuscans]|nr:hypothetical protein [Streptacidiphilus fuscans]